MIMKPTVGYGIRVIRASQLVANMPNTATMRLPTARVMTISMRTSWCWVTMPGPGARP